MNKIFVFMLTTLMVLTLSGVSAVAQDPYGQDPARVTGQARLSPDDQREFDKYYSEWLEATRKNDRDDVEKNARRMQDIMSRYNILRLMCHSSGSSRTAIPATERIPQMADTALMVSLGYLPMTRRSSTSTTPNG